MDVLGALIRVAVLILALGAATPAQARPEPQTPLVRAQGWTETTPAGRRSLWEVPRACSGAVDDDVEAGRVLFRSPVLFGGPAARVGLSCEACHTNGRTNISFLLPELTDKPGFADVTSEWASKVRGDGVFNPVPIPSLVGAASRPAFGARKIPTLRAFVHGVIVEEFQGPEPPEAALDAVVAYVSSLDPAACKPGGERVTLSMAAGDVRHAIHAASAMNTRGEGRTASLLLYAAQDALARVVERLPEARFPQERRTLGLLATELGAMRVAGAPITTEVSRGWQVRFDSVIARLARRERQTYFNPRLLDRALTSPDR